jgi:SAM-dependent methyltransferase
MTPPFGPGNAPPDKSGAAGLDGWFQTPPGQYALDWERARFDAALADVFGYQALQVGLPALDALAANRMPHRWLALPGAPHAPPLPARAALVADSTALPFAEASLDLVALPHTLECSADPHATLREVQRVLVHEGRVAITGLNPASLWRLRRWRHLGGDRRWPPEGGECIGHRRLRDWLRLLEFELESMAFGCYRPAVRGEGALTRFRWMDSMGQRWWPIFGAVYFMLAVKRTRGARLVGPAWKATPAVAGAPAPVANRATTEKKPIEPH